MQGTLRSSCLGYNELGTQWVGEPRYDLVLHVEEVGDGLFKTLVQHRSAGRSPEADCRYAALSLRARSGRSIRGRPAERRLLSPRMRTRCSERLRPCHRCAKGPWSG